MFTIFREEKTVTIGMFLLLTVSLLLRLLLGILYQKMIREADNMAATNNKLLKQCKLKFANCYELNNGVANIPIFVDKFLNRLSLGRLSFETMYHLSGQTMLLSVVCSGIGVCRSIIHGKMLGEILPFYIASFLGLYLYFSVSAVVDIKGKKRVLKVSLVDYLENHLSSRIDVTRQDMEVLFGDKKYVGSRRRNRAAAAGTKIGAKKTVELMPIGNRTPLEGVAAFVNGGEMTGTEGMGFAANHQTDEIAENAKISEEELEALLNEFVKNLS